MSGYNVSEGVRCKLTWKKPTRSKRMNLTSMEMAIESESMSGGLGGGAAAPLGGAGPSALAAPPPAVAAATFFSYVCPLPEISSRASSSSPSACALARLASSSSSTHCSSTSHVTVSEIEPCVESGTRSCASCEARVVEVEVEVAMEVEVMGAEVVDGQVWRWLGLWRGSAAGGGGGGGRGGGGGAGVELPASA